MGKFIKGKTPSGYKFCIDEGVKTDFNFLRALNDANSNDPVKSMDGTIHLISVIFNDDVKEKEFYDYLTEKYGGRIPVEKLTPEIKSIILALNDEDSDIKK